MNPSHPLLPAPATRTLTPARFNPGPGLGIGVAALLLAAAPDTVGARIPEPDTVLYGRIVERLGDREFPITGGQLVWTLRTTGPAGRTVQLTTRLEKLADGRFSYRLRIPHDVLAYDLAVKPGVVGLAAAGSRIEHLLVTLDGKPLTFQPGAVDGFAVDQARRAGLQRVDFQTAASPLDTDGDGAPDTWEDANGFDKFDPADATPASPGGSGQGGGTSPQVGSSDLTTFAQWRAAWFPGASGDLEAFGLGDADQDGVSNLLEYAFDLDPTRAEVSAAAALPRAVQQEGRVGLTFRKRSGATDLSYGVEVSDDLLHWTPGNSQLQETTGPSGETVVAPTMADGTPSHQFFRVVVRRP